LLAALAAGNTVLAPNTELAAALFDAVERAHRDAGDQIWTTPRVRDFGSWQREQYAQYQLTHSDLPRVLSDVEERELWRDVIDSADLGNEFLDPAGAARAARRARRTLSEYRMPLQALEDEKSDEVQTFLMWNSAFDQRCRMLGCVGADDLLGAIDSPAKQVTWIDSPQWRPAARHWLKRQGASLEPLAVPAVRLARTTASSPAAELAAIADWALSNLRGDDGFRAWVCIPDLSQRRAEVVDAFDAALAPQRFGLSPDSSVAPYAVAGGTPLADYAPVRSALALLGASIGAVRFSVFSTLLRAPEFQASELEVSAAARLDLELRRRAPSEADLATWLELAEQCARSEEIGAAFAIQRLRESLRILSGLRGARAFSEWIRTWISAFESGPWAFRSRWSSVEYQAAERFRELLAALAMGDDILGTHARESAQRILRRAARDTAFQVQTGVPAILVSGQLMDPWLNYDGLWVAGCSDESWPPPIAPVPMLPVRLQRQYAVPSAASQSQLALASDLQNRWQQRAQQCVFSHADVGDGMLRAPSPLLPLDAAPLSTAAPDPAPQPHWHALLSVAPTLESLWDELAPPFSIGAERTRGVATLRAQSRCAFRGFGESRLQAVPLEQPVPGFNERERGVLVHSALEHIWHTLRDSNALQLMTPDAQEQLLERSARMALATARKSRDPGARWRERELLRLRNLLGKWLDVERARESFRVEAIEGSSQVATFAGIEFQVRIDRVDELPDGGRVLIDYKTGAANPDWRGERPDNPQLPIYALLRPHALVAVAYAKVNAADPKFVPESEREHIFHSRSRRTALEEQQSFAELVTLWSKRIERIAAEFVAGRAEVAPTSKACKSCHLQGLCRVPASLEAEQANE
jgi:ATP-dependent helicase/nuclease subunit B